MRKPALALILSLLPFLCPEAIACPTINGVFSLSVEQDGKTEVESLFLYTKKDRTGFSYSNAPNGKFWAADGRPKREVVKGRALNLTFSCDQNTVVMHLKDIESGAELLERITPVSEDEMSVEFSDGKNEGIYQRVM